MAYWDEGDAEAYDTLLAGRSAVEAFDVAETAVRGAF
jgi:hypothetical protein